MFDFGLGARTTIATQHRQSKIQNRSSVSLWFSPLMSIVESHSASAPPTVQRRADEVELLLAFVRDRDAHCPRCDYNLRNLTQPVCPECREELTLSVGA